MKTIGFPISHKENEKRRAIVPEDIKKLTYPQNVISRVDLVMYCH